MNTADYSYFPSTLRLSGRCYTRLLGNDGVGKAVEGALVVEFPQGFHAAHEDIQLADLRGRSLDPAIAMVGRMDDTGYCSDGFSVDVVNGAFFVWGVTIEDDRDLLDNIDVDRILGMANGV
jgi:hypothetical protein